MAQLTVTIPDAVLPRLLDAIAANHGYDGSVSKGVFARRWLREELRNELRRYEGGTASRTAETTAAQTADTDSEQITVT